jgi:5,10-methylenetetrahydromethanopterin reductase
MTRRPTFGVAVFQSESIPEMIKLTQLVEALGFSHAWVGDSQMIWREAYVTLSALALHTSRIYLGTSVTNPVTRDPVVTASAFATLQELSEGRAVLGIGLGDSALETIGRKPASLATLRSAVPLMQTLMRGEEAELDSSRVKLAYVNGPAVPVFIGGTGPKLLHLAGSVADGVIMMVGASPEQISYGQAQVRAGAQESGRSPDEVKTVAWIPMSISASDPDWARNNVRAHAARWALRKQPYALPPHIDEVIRAIKHAYDYYGHLHPGSPQSKLVTDELVDLCAITGTPDECLTKARTLMAAGVDQITVIPHGENRAGQIKLFAETVLTRL